MKIYNLFCSGLDQKIKNNFPGYFLAKKFFLFFIVLIAIFAYSGWQVISPKVRISSREFTAGKVKISYPHFDGMTNKIAQDKMNNLIKNRVNNYIKDSKGTEEREDYEAKMSYKVHLVQDNLLSLTLSSYYFTGGVHGHSQLDCYTFNLITGNIIPFKDKFKFDARNRKIINKIIEQQIIDRNITIFEPFKGVSDNPNYYLKKGNKVDIVFQEYEIAAYAEGILEFELSY